MQEQLNNLNLSLNSSQQALSELLASCQQQIAAAQAEAEKAKQEAAEQVSEANRKRDEAIELRRKLSRANRQLLRRCEVVEAAEAIGQKAGKAAVSAIVEAARALREQIPEQERDPEGAAERAEYEALVRQQQELAAQLEARAKLMAELG
jgi:regulator of replication initiation timing